MPNWCFTQITINHEDENKLKDLQDNIKKWTQTNYEESDFGVNWLGNIVGHASIGTIDTGKDSDLSCRGRLNYSNMKDGQLTIATETAWVPMLKMWTRLLEKYLPDAELIYEAEECGNELFCTNDPCMQDTYVIDVCDLDDEESNWYASKTDVIEFLQRILKTNEDDLDKLMELFMESDYEDQACINKWEYVDASAFD